MRQEVRSDSNMTDEFQHYCPVCQDEMSITGDAPEDIQWLPCGHGYHHECLMRYSHSKHTPWQILPCAACKMIPYGVPQVAEPVPCPDTDEESESSDEAPLAEATQSAPNAKAGARKAKAAGMARPKAKSIAKAGVKPIDVKAMAKASTVRMAKCGAGWLTGYRWMVTQPKAKAGVPKVSSAEHVVPKAAVPEADVPEFASQANPSVVPKAAAAGDTRHLSTGRRPYLRGKELQEHLEGCRRAPSRPHPQGMEHPLYQPPAGSQHQDHANTWTKRECSPCNSNIRRRLNVLPWEDAQSFLTAAETDHIMNNPRSLDAVMMDNLRSLVKNTSSHRKDGVMSTESLQSNENISNRPPVDEHLEKQMQLMLTQAKEQELTTLDCIIQLLLALKVKVSPQLHPCIHGLVDQLEKAQTMVRATGDAPTLATVVKASHVAGNIMQPRSPMCCQSV